MVMFAASYAAHSRRDRAAAPTFSTIGSTIPLKVQILQQDQHTTM